MKIFELLKKLTSGKKSKRGRNGRAEKEALDGMKQRYVDRSPQESFNPTRSYNNLR